MKKSIFPRAAPEVPRVCWTRMIDWGCKSPTGPVGGNCEAKATARHREGTWGRSRSRTAAPNANESPRGRPDGGKRARKRDARYSTVVRTVWGTGAAGHWSFLLQEISLGP